MKPGDSMPHSQGSPIIHILSRINPIPRIDTYKVLVQFIVIINFVMYDMLTLLDHLNLLYFTMPNDSFFAPCESGYLDMCIYLKEHSISGTIPFYLIKLQCKTWQYVSISHVLKFIHDTKPASIVLMNKCSMTRSNGKKHIHGSQSRPSPQ